MSSVSSVSLYNKWRSRTFADPNDRPIIGQDHVTRTLRNAIATGQIAHAYIFCGPRGTGKTSAARILARAVNCLRGLSGEPCNACANCTALLDGRQIDLLIEIDAASNRGVDDVRQLRERLLQRPGGADLTGRYKVYIVDEVHMLTTEAFNALLKSLEEPPPHVIFVLCTTDPQKVLPTVLSRCQRFDFRPIPLEIMVRHLVHVAEAEGVRVEPAAVELLGRAAAGGARDALSLLDQAIAYAGAEGDTSALITTAGVQKMLGLTDFDAVCRLADGLAAHDLPACLRLVQEVASKGGDLRQFTRQVLDFLRAVMLVRSDAAGLLQLDEDTKHEVTLRAPRFRLAEVIRLIKLFAQAEQGLKSPSAQPQLPLELAVVEALVAPFDPAAAPPDAPVEMDASSRQAAARQVPPSTGLEDVPRQAPIPAPAAVSAPAPESAAAPPPVRAAEAPPPPSTAAAGSPAPEEVELVQTAAWPGPGASGTDRLAPVAPPVGPARDEAPELVAAAPSTPVVPAVQSPAAAAGDGAAVLDLDRVKLRWNALLDTLRRTPGTRTLEAVLKSGAPVAVEAGNVVVVQFPYAFHANRIQEVSNKIAIGKALSQVIGAPSTVRSVVAGSNEAAPERPRAAVGQDDPVVAKALRIWRAHILSPSEVAAVDALPEVAVAAVGEQPR